jgi:hypothetical protein
MTETYARTFLQTKVMTSMLLPVSGNRPNQDSPGAPVDALRAAFQVTSLPGSEQLDPPRSEDHDVVRLVSASREAEEVFGDFRRKRRIRTTAWVGLCLAALAPAALALSFPAKVVEALPASIVLYDWLWQDVNIYGLEIRQVDVRNLLIENERMIAVKGQLTNVSRSERKIPWLRFGLKDGAGADLYQWQLDTGSRPLQPGESTNFTTRIAAPPDAASRLEIRFARADEIGSNNQP